MSFGAYFPALQQALYPSFPRRLGLSKFLQFTLPTLRLLCFSLHVQVVRKLCVHAIELNKIYECSLYK